MITVIGGGPAGLAAALAAAQAGARVLLLESNTRLGGQYWRHLPEEGANAWAGQAGQRNGYVEGFLLRNKVRSNPNIEALCEAQIWSATKNENTITVNFLQHGVSHSFSTRILILATGAYDRTLPFPGWDIPGVMTPGAAQALLKGSNVLAGKRIVVAGSGPFLLPVADGLRKAGAEIVGLFEAQRIRKWLRHSMVALRNLRKIIEGAKYLQGLHPSRGYAVISAHASDSGVLDLVRVAQIDSKFRIKEGTQQDIRCDVAAIGWGFTPDLSLAHSLDLVCIAGEDGFPIVMVDEFQRSSDFRIYAAGEITGVGGSDLALSEGSIAGKSAADQLGGIDRRKTLSEVSPHIRKRARQRDFARTLLKIYSVEVGWRSWVTDSTIVCRCEEVSAREITTAIRDLGATDIRSVKLLTRVGMGACQGRICSRSVIDIIASQQEREVEVEEYMSAGRRSIIKPITLGELAEPTIPYDAL